MNQIAIVILNYNGKTHLECFLPSVVKHQQDHTIIIADNASTDDSLEFLKINYPSFRIIEINENFGFARGYNEALQKLKDEFEYFLLLNNDVEVTENWISPLLHSFQNENVAACQPKILAYNNKNISNTLEQLEGLLISITFLFVVGEFLTTLKKMTVNMIQKKK